MHHIRLLLFAVALGATLAFIDNVLPSQKLATKTTTTTTTTTRQPPFPPVLENMEHERAIIDDPNKFFIQRVQKAVNSALPLPAIESLSYPTVDIRPWLQPQDFSQAARDAVVRQVLEYASTSGSFDIVGHDIAPRIFRRLEQQSRAFFDLPLEVKLNYRNPQAATKAGYTALRETSVREMYDHEKGNADDNTRDLRETYALNTPFEHEHNIPPPNRAFKEAMEEYITLMDKIDIALHTILTKALSLAKGVDLSDNYLNDLKIGAAGVLKCSRNPPVQSADDKLGAHSDWGSVTLIYSDSPGLEELDGETGRWVKAPIGKLHVTIGDVMHMWSNGLFKANIHRVGPSFSQDRVSFIYFCSQGEVVSSSSSNNDNNALLVDNDRGVYPVVAPNEQPLFGKISVAGHNMGYHRMYTAESKLVEPAARRRGAGV